MNQNDFSKQQDRRKLGDRYRTQSVQHIFPAETARKIPCVYVVIRTRTACRCKCRCTRRHRSCLKLLREGNGHIPRINPYIPLRLILGTHALGVTGWWWSSHQPWLCWVQRGAPAQKKWPSPEDTAPSCSPA